MTQINPYEEVDYLTEARERVTEQFIGKEIFDKYLQILMSGDEAIQQAIKDIMQLRSIDTATGVQLDNIGEIVGQPRELLEADLYNYFGFEGTVGTDGIGDTEDPSTGGYFYTEGLALGGNVLLDDETYRSFIRAKIFKNTTASTPEDFIEVINLIFNTSVSALIREGDAEVFLLFGRKLNSFERALLGYVSYSQGYPSRLVPKTVGVKMNYGEFVAQDYFGFQGSPGVKGFSGYQPTLDGDFACDGSQLCTATIEEGGTFATLY